MNILEVFQKTPVVCPFYSNEKICFAQYISQVLHEQVLDNQKYEYPEIESYLQYYGSQVKNLTFYEQSFSSSGNPYFRKIQKIELSKYLETVSRTLIIGDQYTSCDVFWKDISQKEHQLFVNKFDNSNMFAIFQYKGHQFFLPFGNYFYQLQKEKNQTIKLGVNNVIALTQERFMQVVTIMIPQENLPPKDLKISYVMHQDNYINDQSQVFLSFPQMNRIQDLKEPQITIQLWSMDLIKKRITKHGKNIHMEFTDDKRVHKLGGAYQKELKFAPGVGDYQLDIAYEVQKDVYVRRSLYGKALISQKLQEIDWQIESFLPAIHLLHKEIKFTQKGLSQIRRHQIELTSD